MSAPVTHLPVPMVRHALDLAARGFRVLPVHPGRKKPIFTKWASKATTDHATIREIWAAHPDANVGMLMSDGIVVIDLDVGHKPGVNGIANYKTLLEEHGQEHVPTLSATTPRGGQHLYYRAPADVHVKGGADRLGPGIDVKADGQVLGHGSRVNGKEYQWRDPAREIADLPAWLLAKLTATAPEKPTKTAEEKSHALLQTDIEEMLHYIRPETLPDWSRDQWRDVLFGLHTAQRDDLPLLEVADRWSQTVPAYEGADDVATVFNGANGSITIGSLWALAKQGGFKPDAAQLARLQPPVLAEKEFDGVPDPAAGDTDGPFSRTAADVLATRSRTRWLIRDILEEQVIAILAGHRGSYKSFAALNWAMQVAVDGHDVYVISAEGGDFDRRLKAWLMTFAPTLDPRDLPLHVVERRLDLNTAAGIKAVQDDFARLQIEPALIVADTSSKLSGGLDENDNSQVKQFIGRLDNGLKRRYGATVLIVAHTGHNEKGRPRGASAFGADTDAEYIASRNERDGTVEITRERFKSSPERLPLVLRSHSVLLGYEDDEGKAVTSLVLKPAMRPKPADDFAKREAEFVKWWCAEERTPMSLSGITRIWRVSIWSHCRTTQKQAEEWASEAISQGVLLQKGQIKNGPAFILNPFNVEEFAAAEVRRQQQAEDPFFADVKPNE